MDTKSIQRRYDLDWMRVIAFSGVFFYHCARFFNSSDWTIKNSETSPLIDIFTSIFDLWGMALIFAISGASIFFALHPQGTVRFLFQRALRLLAPLGVGILVLAPPQMYLDRLTHGKFTGTFIQFIPHFFQPANFAWTGVHLWYLEYLFIFTLVLSPLFIWLKRPSGQNAIRWISRFSKRNGAIFLWAFPTALVAIAVDPFGIMRPSLSEAFLRLVMFPLPLIYGYLIFADDGIQQAIIRVRRVSLVLSLGLSMVALLIRIAMTEWGWKLSMPAFILVTALASLLIWSYVLAAFGYGMRYLTRSNRLLSYANEAVLPFYILHQPVILILGYFIIPLTVPIVGKYLMITPLAFFITIGLYEFGIRRNNFLRRAFGLKPRSPVTQEVKLATQPSS